MKKRIKLNIQKFAEDGEIRFKVNLDGDQASRTMDTLKSKADNMGSSFEKLGDGLTKTGKVISTAVTAPIVALGTASAKTAIDFVKLKESSMGVFSKMLGGAEAADQMYESLLKVAKASTYSQETFLTAGKTLVGMGTSAEDTTKYLQAMTDAVAGFGGSSADIESLATVFGKVQAKGKVLTDDLNMLAERGVNGLQILASHYGKTTDEMQEMVSKGMVPAKEGLDILCDGIEKGYTYAGEFHQGLEGMAKSLKGGTLTGALDSLHTSFRSFALGVTNMDPTKTDNNIKLLTDTINKFNTSLSNSYKVFKPLTDMIKPLLEYLGKLLDKYNEWLENAPEEEIEKVGKVIKGLAFAGPLLLGLGKGFSVFGGLLSKFSSSGMKIGGVLSSITSGFGGLLSNIPKSL